METQLHHDDGPGNWIAFLFGVMFNAMAITSTSSTINYMGHALLGGIICLLFKIMGDLFSPVLRQTGERLAHWLRKQFNTKR